MPSIPASPLPDGRTVLTASTLEDADAALGYEAALPYLMAGKPQDDETGITAFGTSMD